MDIALIKDKFESIKIVEKNDPLQDTSFNVFFENGYGGSVVRGPYTYGGDRGLYEVAVISGNQEDWDLCYDTLITGNVEGHLTKEAVIKMLIQIQRL